LWAYARVHLRLTDDEFGDLTLHEVQLMISAFVDHETREVERFDWWFASLNMRIHNSNCKPEHVRKMDAFRLFGKKKNDETFLSIEDVDGIRRAMSLVSHRAVENDE
jgi:hypothetical protein